MDARCRIELFGWLRVLQDGPSSARFQTRQTGAVLAYLALHHGRSHPRDRLMEVAWPEDAGYTDRHKLRVALNSLRRQTQPPGVPRPRCNHGRPQHGAIEPGSGDHRRE